MPVRSAAKRKRRRRDRRVPAILFGISLILVFILFSTLFLDDLFTPITQALNVSSDGSPVSLHDGIVISEVMSDNNSALPDENGSFTDWLEITNTNSYSLSLKGLTLSDRSDKAKFLFPDITLNPGEYILVFCDKTNQDKASGALHAKFGLSSLGDAVFLFDTDGYVLDEVTVPTLNINESYARMEDGSFAVTEQYSPGYPNTEDGYVAYLSNYTIAADTLMITELMAAPRSGLRDEDDELSDWVELYNAGSQMITLSNYYLSDSEDKLLQWRFPAGAVIAPGGYYVVFCSGKDRAGENGAYPHTNFSLAAEGETVTLCNALGQLVDRVSYETMPPDCSYGRSMSAAGWQEFTLATPGAPNNAKGAALADEYLRATNRSGVYVTEVMSSNDSVTAVEGEACCDWVELYNSSSSTVDLSGFGLSDNINWPRKWQFPAGTILWPGNYMVVLLDKSQVSGNDASRLHASFALARAGGETITLSDSSGRVLDKITLPGVPTDYSYGRTQGVDGFFYYSVPTPSALNGSGFSGFAAKPALSVAGGLYQQDITVSLLAPDGVTVRYTLDGSVPTVDNGILYTGPIAISDTSCLRARGFQSGLQPSDTVSATYVMKTYYSLPVVCIVADPASLWDDTNGIFAAGAGINLSSYQYIPFKNPTPTYRKLKELGTRANAYIEMFSSDTGEVILSQGAEIGLIGQYSLDMPQKSIKVVSKAKFGAKYFNASLFEDRPFTEYRSFVLRNSGNDCVWTRMVDGVQSRMVDLTDSGVIHQAWQPVVVYINGKYWGHYNLRERVDEYFVASHEGIALDSSGDIDVLESNGTAKSQVNNGTNADWVAFMAAVKASGFSANNPQDLQYILDNVDVDNYFDYVIFEIFFANTDSGNIRFYKTPGGKWKWILYDLDYGLFNSSSNGISNWLDPSGHGANDDIDNTLIRKLLDNKEMFDKFMTRFGVIFRTLSSEATLSVVDESYNLLLPEMQMHFSRWAEENLKNISADQPTSVEGCVRYWKERVTRLKNVILKRPAYCWRQVAEWFKLSDAEMTAYFGPIPVVSTDATWNSDKARAESLQYLYGSGWASLYQ